MDKKGEEVVMISQLKFQIELQSVPKVFKTVCEYAQVTQQLATVCFYHNSLAVSDYLWVSSVALQPICPSEAGYHFPRAQGEREFLCKVSHTHTHAVLVCFASWVYMRCCSVCSNLYPSQDNKVKVKSNFIYIHLYPFLPNYNKREREQAMQPQ